MRCIAVLELSVARSEIDMVQKDSKQTILREMSFITTKLETYVEETFVPPKLL